MPDSRAREASLGGPDAGESPPGRGWTVPEGERGLVKGLLDQPLEQPVGDQAASEVRGGAGEGGRSGCVRPAGFLRGQWPECRSLSEWTRRRPREGPAAHPYIPDAGPGTGSADSVPERIDSYDRKDRVSCRAAPPFSVDVASRAGRDRKRNRRTGWGTAVPAELGISAAAKRSAQRDWCPAPDPGW